MPMQGKLTLLATVVLAAAQWGCVPTGTEDLAEQLDDALDPAPDYVDEPADEPADPEGAESR
jgi:hypothetical protein